MSRRLEEQDLASSRGRPEGLPKRWSAQRKAEVVLRLLRGEDIGEVSREVRVTPAELERLPTTQSYRSPMRARSDETPLGRTACPSDHSAGLPW